MYEHEMELEQRERRDPPARPRPPQLDLRDLHPNTLSSLPALSAAPAPSGRAIPLGSLATALLLAVVLTVAALWR